MKRARDALGRALAIEVARDDASSVGESRTRIGLAETLLEQDDLDGAETQLRVAFDNHETDPLRPAEAAWMHFVNARLLWARGHSQRARQQADTARAKLDEVPGAKPAAEARLAAWMAAHPE